MFENFTGASAFGDALYIVAFQLRQAFYKGKRNHGVRKVSPIKPETSIFNLVELIPE